ncbi:hypothetical protein D3C80_1268840 [compost metagenome]
MPAHEKATGFKLLQRFPQDRPRDIEPLRQFALARQPVAIAQYTVEDQLLEAQDHLLRCAAVLDARKKGFVHRTSLRRNPAPCLMPGKLSAKHRTGQIFCPVPRGWRLVSLRQLGICLSKLAFVKAGLGQGDDGGFLPSDGSKQLHRLRLRCFHRDRCFRNPGQEAGTKSQWPRVDLLSQARRKGRWLWARCMRAPRCCSHRRASSSSSPS